jgi:hypothetical protein
VGHMTSVPSFNNRTNNSILLIEETVSADMNHHPGNHRLQLNDPLSDVNSAWQNISLTANPSFVQEQPALHHRMHQ